MGGGGDGDGDDGDGGTESVRFGNGRKEGHKLPALNGL